MTINGNTSSAYAYGSYGQGQLSPSPYFSQFQPQFGQVQPSGGSPMASILQKIQSAAKQFEASGESAQDAFSNALEQVSQQLNPALTGMAMSNTSGTAYS